MHKRKKEWFGTPAPAPTATAGGGNGDANINKCNQVVDPSPAVLAPGEKVLYHGLFRPKNAGVSERLTIHVPITKKTTGIGGLLTNALVAGTMNVFNKMNINNTNNTNDANISTNTDKNEVIEVPTKLVSIIWANPTTTMMSHNKYLVYSYRIV